MFIAGLELKHYKSFLLTYWEQLKFIMIIKPKEIKTTTDSELLS